MVVIGLQYSFFFTTLLSYFIYYKLMTADCRKCHKSRFFFYNFTLHNYFLDRGIDKSILSGNVQRLKECTEYRVKFYNYIVVVVRSQVLVHELKEKTRRSAIQYAGDGPRKCCGFGIGSRLEMATSSRSTPCSRAHYGSCRRTAQLCRLG